MNNAQNVELEDAFEPRENESSALQLSAAERILKELNNGGVKHGSSSTVTTSPRQPTALSQYDDFAPTLVNRR